MLHFCKFLSFLQIIFLPSKPCRQKLFPRLSWLLKATIPHRTCCLFAKEGTKFMGIFLASGTAVMMCKALSTLIFFPHRAQEFSIHELHLPASAKRRLQQRLRFSEGFDCCNTSESAGHHQSSEAVKTEEKYLPLKANTSLSDVRRMFQGS